MADRRRARREEQQGDTGHGGNEVVAIQHVERLRGADRPSVGSRFSERQVHRGEDPEPDSREHTPCERRVGELTAPAGAAQVAAQAAHEEQQERDSDREDEGKGGVLVVVLDVEGPHLGGAVFSFRRIPADREHGDDDGDGYDPS